MDNLEKTPITLDVGGTNYGTIAEPALLTFASNVMLNGIGNPGTRAIYQTCLTQFFGWLVAQGATFCRANIKTYLAWLQEQGKAASTRNNALAAIKRLAKEAYFASQLPHDTYLGIADVRGAKKRVVRPAQWLTLRQVNELLALPNVDTAKGLRDRALLGVLVGCALRRQEICDLTIASIEQRSGRWVFVVHGKGDKTRLVGIAPGLKVSVDEWLSVSRAVTIGENLAMVLPLFCVIRRGNHPAPAFKLDPQSIEDILRSYSARMDPPLPKLAPHDMRRTHARLAREAGSDLEQIQFALGHDSIQTTSIYLGMNQNLNRTPSDMIDVNWKGGKG